MSKTSNGRHRERNRCLLVDKPRGCCVTGWLRCVAELAAASQKVIISFDSKPSSEKKEKYLNTCIACPYQKESENHPLRENIRLQG